MNGYPVEDARMLLRSPRAKHMVRTVTKPSTELR